MKSVIKRTVNSVDVPDYLLEIISMNYDKCFLDITAIENNEKITMIYDVKNLSKIDINGYTLYQAISLIKEIVICEENNENHLIFPEDYLICLDLIFIPNKGKGIKLLYYPDENGKGFIEKLIGLIEEISQYYQYSDKALMMSIIENISQNEFNTIKLIKFLEALEQNVMV
ncbi:MAG: hypothetical protein JJE03_04150 [Peptostreptococcaceae bacterium]|nr:hypothetical protein [Peptostreptococcaceae bacterium]